VPAKREVTLCIAALCEHKGHEAIVYCSDRKITEGSASSEVGDKMNWFIPKWPVVLAGTVFRARELIDTFRTELDRARITRKTIFDVFKRIPRVHRRKLLDEESHKQSGLSSYKNFRRNKNQFPDYQTRLSAIHNVDLECNLILGGFMKDEAQVFAVYADTTVVYVEDFAAIGSGAELATAMLHKRMHSGKDSLKDTLYHVYEAKKFAEMDAFVGKRTYIDIIEPRGSARPVQKVKIRSVTKKGLNYLKERHQQFSLQDIARLKLKKRYIETYQ